MDALTVVAETPRSPAPLALIDVLDRDGTPRQSLAVQAWPVMIGRAFDNDLVLSDPHVAAHHLVIDVGGAGLELTAAETDNGVLLGGRRRLARGEAAAVTADGEPAEITVGRTQLRLRLPGHSIAAELPLAPPGAPWRRAMPLVSASVMLAAGVLFTAYLDTDPEAFARTAGTLLLSLVIGAAVWCTVWALLSKTFTRQAQFGWHLRVFVFAGVASIVLSVLPSLLAFSMSWPWLSDFDFVGAIVVIAAALYFHLLAVEPARRRLIRVVAVVCGGVAVALSLWFNVQRSDQFGDELYMSHLFPPALRLASPVATDAFIAGLASLKGTLDKKAKEPARGGDDTSRGPDEE